MISTELVRKLVQAVATETTAGVLRVATQAETDAGAADDRIVTPKKLRWGFAASLQVNSGYVAVPSWLGGWVLQYQKGTASNNSATDIALPIAFPNAGLSALVVDGGAAGQTLSIDGSTVFPTLGTVRVNNNTAASTACYVWALGK